MAFTRLSLPFSLLLLSLLVIAFAADYGYKADSPQPKPEYGDSKPNYADKPTTYKPNSDEKPVYGSKPEGEAKANYGTNQYNYKPKEEVREKSGYGTTKPDSYKPKPKPEEIEKREYEKKPYVEKSKPEEEEKPEYVKKPEGEKKPNYETKKYTYKPKPEEKETTDYDTTKPDFYKPKPEEEKPYSIAVEGFVYCKTASSHYPISKALAKVTCEAVDEVGVEKTVPICSVPTDAKGYFYATVTESLKLKDCKVFLESSPETNCNVPTDVNKGITGFPISGDVYRVLNDKHTKLYSAQPFFYTSETKSAPNGY
ncbi:hypothetical protein PTKIN_Ptkin14bG0217900 [Pterospermum kingtungense]